MNSCAARTRELAWTDFIEVGSLIVKNTNSTISRETEQERLARTIRLRATPNPFEGIPRDRVDAVLMAIGRENRQIFAQSLAQLRADMRATDPVKLLSNLAVYGLFHSEGHDPEVGEGQPHLQLHFELIQALALMDPLEEFAAAVAVPPQLVQAVFDGIKQLADAYRLKGLAVPAPPKTDEERSRLVSQAAIRAQTVAVRNFGYFDQLKSLYTQLLAPLDDDCEDQTGLRLTALLEFVWNVIALIESRVNTDIRKMANVFGAGAIADAVRAYYAEYPELDGDPGTLIALYQGIGASLQHAKFLLLYHRELSFPGYFTLRLADLVSCYPGEIEVEQLREAVDLWSLQFGELAGRDPEHVFLDNPIWSQPFIKLADHTYFCPVPGVLWSFSLRLVEDFIAAKTTLKARYELRRDKFLESQVEDLFRRAFPSAQVFAGSQWSDPATGRSGENDLLVVLGDVALVIEDKAGNVSDKALRAHPERLARTLRDLVVRPAEQARNFITLLKRDPDPHWFDTARGQTNQVDARGVRRFVPISVTWETFGAFRLRWPLLERAGLIPPGHEPAVTMSLADLDTVLDVLDSEWRRMHYLVRRSELERDERIVGDEIDLLGYYLNEGFGSAALRREDVGQIDLTMQSKHVDRFIELPPHQRPTNWPGTRLAPLWQKLVDDLNNRRPDGWVRATMLLLNVPLAVQEQIGSWLEAAARKAGRAESSAKLVRSRRKVRAAGLTLELIASAGLQPDELIDVARAVTDLDASPSVLAVCVRLEERGRPIVGL